MYLLLGSSYRASLCTSAAIYASISIDNELAVTLGDSSYRALSLTSAAGNAVISDMKSHNSNLLN